MGIDPDQTQLAALPVEQRSVVQMKLWEGLTLEEIAAAQDDGHWGDVASRLDDVISAMDHAYRAYHGPIVRPGNIVHGQHTRANF